MAFASLHISERAQGFRLSDHIPEKVPKNCKFYTYVILHSCKFYAFSRLAEQPPFLHILGNYLRIQIKINLFRSSYFLARLLIKDM
jgi:hypothetical protein